MWRYKHRSMSVPPSQEGLMLVFGNRHSYDWSEKKVPEKLDYIHNNPVKRGLVEKAGDWSRLAGSSRRFYYLEDSSGAGDGSDAVIAYMAKTAMYAPPPYFASRSVRTAAAGL
jgi:hypothetical protein